MSKQARCCAAQRPFIIPSSLLQRRSVLWLILRLPINRANMLFVSRAPLSPTIIIAYWPVALPLGVGVVIGVGVEVRVGCASGADVAVGNGVGVRSAPAAVIDTWASPPYSP